MFAGLNRVYAQPNGDGSKTDYTENMVLTGAPECAVPTVLTCTSQLDELHPQAGIPYTYDVTVPTDATVHWFVLANDNNAIISLGDIASNIGVNVDDPGDGTGNYILSSTDYNVTNTTSSTTITWKAFDGIAQQVLLVAYVVDAIACTDNIELYRILPVPTFTLDVNAIAQTGVEIGTAGTDDAEDCVSPIESAIYTPSANPLTIPGELVADYGENWVFFTVTAANFTHSWQPKFQITYTGTQGEVVEAGWAYPTDALANTNWNTINDLTGTGASTETEVLHSGTVIGTSVGADDGTGECIVVRVRIDHGNQPENAVNDQTIRMAVNGFMYDQTALNYTNPLNEDLHYEDIDGNGLCDDTDGFDNDWVEYRLTPRPQIISNTNAATGTDQEFETKADNSDNLGNN